MGVGSEVAKQNFAEQFEIYFLYSFFGTSPEGEGGGGRGDNAAADDDGGM